MLRVKDWKRFQHFKDRRPPWIKLYREILDDPEWHELSGEAAKGLVMLWLIASEYDGCLPDSKKLAFRLRTTVEKTNSLIEKLSHWLEQTDDSAISDRYQSDAPETERETEKKHAVSAFDPISHLKGKDVPDQLIADWLALRKAKKAKVTLTAIEGIEREAGKASLSLTDALQKCCERGWQGFDASWLSGGGQSNTARVDL